MGMSILEGPLPDVQADDSELRYYAALLAYIMAPEDDRSAMWGNAEHIWRIELSVEQHERLQQFLPAEEEA
jgi:hypothetical protein